MSSRQFISSTQFPHNQQFRKFQLPQHRVPDTQNQKNQHLKHGEKILNQDRLQKFILEKIAEVQRENEKLLGIANQLNRSSLSFSLNEQLTSLVYPIQQQMKSAFNQLIQSIQEFYIDIDTKIKDIGSYLATLSGVDTLQTSKKDHDDVIFSSNHHHNNNQTTKQKPFSLTQEQQTIRSINLKIQIMQKDLQQTKSNETKLMSIIEKLVEKYQLNNQTTIVNENPFLKKKVQTIVNSRVEPHNPQRVHHSPQNFNEYQVHQPQQRLNELHSFSKPNHMQNNRILPSGINSARDTPINPFNQIRSNEKPQRNVSNIQNPNDYSIYQQLNKIEQNNNHTLQNQRSFGGNSFSQPKDVFAKNKPKPKLVAQKMETSSISVNSYAYSNSMVESDDGQCFIKKLYSKQAPSLTKVSLKNCSNPNKTVFQLNRPQDQTHVDQSNKNHREAYLLNQLKRIN